MEDQEDGMRFSVCNLLTNDNCIDLRLGPGVSRPRLSDEARVSNTTNITKTYITSNSYQPSGAETISDLLFFIVVLGFWDSRGVCHIRLR